MAPVTRHPSPSSAFAESLAAFTKSVHLTFNEVNKNARHEISQAVVEANEARRERDDAVKAMHAAQEEVQGCKLELRTCNSSLKQAEMTAAHQVETISQLRREIAQWKDQARNWQEHFLRVEQERCALSTKLHEIMSGQLAAQTIPRSQSTHGGEDSPLSEHVVQTTPSAYPQTPHSEHSARGTTKSRLTHHRAESSQMLEPSASIEAGLSKRANSSPRKANYATRSEPTPHVVRRVQAIINVPLKDEDTEDNHFPTPSSVSIDPSQDSETAPPIRRLRVRRSSQRIPQDYYADGGPSEDEDTELEEDELMMGVEENHGEIYGVQHVKPKGRTKDPSKNKRKPAADPQSRQSKARRI